MQELNICRIIPLNINSLFTIPNLWTETDVIKSGQDKELFFDNYNYLKTMSLSYRIITQNSSFELNHTDLEIYN